LEILQSEGNFDEIKVNTVTANVNNPIKVSSLNELLSKHEGIFATSKYDIGTYKNYEALVKLRENKYVASRPYEFSLQDKDEIESQVKSLLEKGLIEHSTSPFASPVTLVFKKEEGTK